MQVVEGVRGSVVVVLDVLLVDDVVIEVDRDEAEADVDKKVLDDTDMVLLDVVVVLLDCKQFMSKHRIWWKM